MSTIRVLHCDLRLANRTDADDLLDLPRAEVFVFETPAVRHDLEGLWRIFNSYPAGAFDEDLGEPDVLSLDDADWRLCFDYRSLRLRSLSVGDAIQINDHLHVVLPFGFSPDLA